MFNIFALLSLYTFETIGLKKLMRRKRPIQNELAATKKTNLNSNWFSVFPHLTWKDIHSAESFVIRVVNLLLKKKSYLIYFLLFLLILLLKLVFL